MARKHGTRAKAIREGCKCIACRVAAANYERDRKLRHRPSWRVRNRRGSTSIFEVVDREGAEVALITRDRREAESEAARLRHEANREGDCGPWTPWATAEDLDDLAGVFEAFDQRGYGTRRIAELTGLDRKTIRAAALAARGRTSQRLRRETAEALLNVTSSLRD